MGEVDESIELDVPVATAYNQWTQFEDFPSFMDNVEAVRQIDDTHLHWVVKVAGKEYEWDAEITYQDPDQHIAWRAVDGKKNTGSVQFKQLDGDRTRMRVRMTWEEEGAAETLGEKVGVDDRTVKADLGRFKELIESRREETGAWRGEVREGDVRV
jgi:uncharacterized membrane protein